jgi:hypothetical protein
MRRCLYVHHNTWDHTTSYMTLYAESGEKGKINYLDNSALSQSSPSYNPVP